MIRITATPAALEKMRDKGPQIIQGLVGKMNELMIRLQRKITDETIPTMFPNGASNIPATVRFFPAVLTTDNSIVGGVAAGGPRTTTRTKKSGAFVDYSGVQEYGISHSYEILPFDKKMLSFIIDGKRIFAARVLHPPLESRPFMRSSLHEFAPEIQKGMNQQLLYELLFG